MKIFHSAAEAAAFAGIPADPRAPEIEKIYPTLVNDYYLKLTDFSQGDRDPIYRQWHPDPAELEDSTSSYDPLAEEEQMPVPKLIRRYYDRAVLLATGKCAMRCRFCFRKRAWTSGTELDDLTSEELIAVCNWLRQNPEVREVLISGGDPLYLPIGKLKMILDAIAAIDSIEVIRLASRLPAVMPEAVTPEKIDLITHCRSLWLATHFNHPREVTPEAEKLCTTLISHGVPIINQTVLLKGVNDDSRVLEELFRKLIRIKVKPHYLFHVDPVRGVRHFATGIEKGLDILRDFRPRLSSLAVPTFAIDLPEGGGKVSLQPNYQVEGKFPDIHYKKLISYHTRPDSEASTKD